MQMTMRERITQAIRDTHLISQDVGDEVRHRNYWIEGPHGIRHLGIIPDDDAMSACDEYVADAVLAAMEEPTEAMVEAGMPGAMNDPQRIWRAMVKEAAKP